MRNFLVAGNWKMHGSESANAALTDGILAGMPDADNVTVLICPPFPYLVAEAGRGSGQQSEARRAKRLTTRFWRIYRRGFAGHAARRRL